MYVVVRLDQFFGSSMEAGQESRVCGIAAGVRVPPVVAGNEAEITARIQNLGSEVESRCRTI